MIKMFVSQTLSSNVYLIYDKNEGLIVDAGASVYEIADFVKRNSINVKYIVLTHGHFDHVAYIGEYIREFPSALVCCHTDEVKVLGDSYANVSELFGAPCVFNYDYHLLNEGDLLTVGDITFEVLHTPGHTCGCICLLCKEKELLLTGDTLFKNGYGRYDFMYGDFKTLQMSLKRLLSLDPNIIFYSGHGERSKIGNEIS